MDAIPSPVHDLRPASPYALPGGPSKRAVFGILDLVVASNDALPRLEGVVDASLPVLRRLEGLEADARDAAKQSADRGNTVAGALRTASHLVGRLDEPAADIEGLGAQFTRDVLGMAPTLSALLDVVDRNAAAALRNRSLLEFFIALRRVAGVARDAVGRLERLHGSLEPSAGYSRALRPPLRAIRQGLLGMQDAGAILDDSDRRIERLLEANRSLEAAS